MKIIYYSPHPTHDIVSEVGYSTHQRETINAMKKLGHQVFPVIMGGTEKAEVQSYHAEIATEGGIKKLIKKIFPRIIKNTLKDYLLIKHDRNAAARLRAAIAEHKPDLVYERGEYMQNKGLLLCKALNVKHFLEVNAPVVEEMRIWEGPSLLHYLALAKEKSKIKNTHGIFAVSSAIKKVLEEKYECKVPVHIIPNCINPGRLIPDEKSIEALRTKFQLSGKKTIGFVGSIFPYHGVDLLIKAFKPVNEKQPDTKLVIVGDGYLRKSYEQLALEVLPAGSYLFTGKVPHAEVNNYIGLFDIAVMPDSNWYGSPIKIFEYGFLKKGIVAPNKAPLLDVMQHNVDGIISETSESALTKSLLFAVENPGKMNEMGIHFHNKIMEHYTWEKQAQFILSKA